MRFSPDRCPKCGASPSHVVEQLTGLAGIGLVDDDVFDWLGETEVDWNSQESIRDDHGRFDLYCESCTETWPAIRVDADAPKPKPSIRAAAAAAFHFLDGLDDNVGLDPEGKALLGQLAAALEGEEKTLFHAVPRGSDAASIIGGGVEACVVEAPRGDDGASRVDDDARVRLVLDALNHLGRTVVDYERRR